MNLRRTAPRIAVVLWLNQDHGRHVLHGIMEYYKERDDVQIEVYDVHNFAEKAKEINECDGCVAALTLHEAERLHRLSVPTVLAPRIFTRTTAWALVATDGEAVGRLAAEHLLSIGLVRFAAPIRYPPMGEQTEDQTRAFEAMVRAGGGSLVHGPASFSDHDLGRWLLALEKPCGVFCVSDVDGVRVVRTALEAGVRVPEEVAVVATGDDPITCTVHRPTLSSVACLADRAGYLAAEMLEGLLSGAGCESRAVPPLRVVVRQSSDVLHLGDPLVEQAVRFLQLNLATSVRPEDLARHIGVSRTELFQRFRAALGHGVHEELVRMRLAKATTLLARTDQPVKAVAATVGIPDLPNFSRFVRAHTGLAPRSFRESHRDASVPGRSETGKGSKLSGP